MYADDNIFIRKEDGLLVCGFQKNTIIDRQISSKIIKKRIELSDGKNQYILADGRGIKYWTMSSRNHDMQEYAYALIEKTAIVINSQIISSIHKLTLKIFPSPIPLKIFTDYEKAKKWLLNEKKKDKAKLNLLGKV